MKTKKILSILLTVTMALTLLPISALPVSAASVIHVNAAATGANDGTSWANAFTTLQAALDAAAEGDEIRVAAGTYYPTKIAGDTPSDDPRDMAFLLKKDVKIYGGYNAANGARNTKANITTLSGDIGVPGDPSDNVYHVVVSAGDVGTALLDGFTITGGNANSSGYMTVNGFTTDDKTGGGIYIGSGSPAFNQCLITGNTAVDGGGGISGNTSDYTMTNCIITGNSGDGYGGGGILHYSCNPTITQCLITDNTSFTGGGGMANWGYSNPKLTNCTVADNTASYDGGINNAVPESIPSIANCIIVNNTGGDGGTGSTIITSIIGDLFYADNANTSKIDRTGIFIGGGNYRLKDGSPAVDRGYGTIEGVAIPGTDFDGNPRFSGPNLDLGPYELRYEILSTRKIIYVDVNKANSYPFGTNWESAYPSLGYALTQARAGDEIRVAAGTYYTDDVYEYKWDSAPTDWRDYSFILPKDVNIYGGYDAKTGKRDIVKNKTILSGDIGVKNDNSDNSYHVVCSVGNVGSTELDGFTITGGNADGNGSGTVNGVSCARQDGGGLYIRNSSPVISNCVITGNIGMNAGGGMYINSSEPAIINCLIYGNAAATIGEGDSYGGGGIYVNSISSNFKMVNCTVTENIGGGLFFGDYTLYRWGPTRIVNIVNSIIAKNSGDDTNIYVFDLEYLSQTTILGEYFFTDLDYYYIDANAIFMGGGDYSLKPGSPAIDTGTYPIDPVYFPVYASIPDTDLAGNPRFLGGVIDLGAYEYKPQLNLRQEIYFGKYTGGDSSGPIKWLVMEKNSDTITLWTQTSVASRYYNYYTPDIPNYWSGTQICQWLNGYGGYTGSGFLPNAFTPVENKAITEYGGTISANAFSDGRYVFDKLDQKIVLPSVEEALDGGAWGMTSSERALGDEWFLREISPIDSFAKAVYTDGTIYTDGRPYPFAPRTTARNIMSIRPALKLPLSSIVLMSDAVNGKDRYVVGGGLLRYGYDGAVKLTVTDQSLTLANVALLNITGSEAEFYYTGVSAGKTLSAIVKDSGGNVTYYGKLIEDIPASGAASVTLPDGFIDGMDSLWIFVEQDNGNYETDYASVPLQLYFAYSPKTAVATYAGGGGTITPEGGAGLYTVTPDSGFMIDKVIVDGVLATAGDISAHTVTITNDGKEHSIVALFAKISASVLLGDVDGDGEVSLLDAMMLEAYLSNPSVPIDITAADMNGDGKADAVDLAVLRIYLQYVIE